MEDSSTHTPDPIFRISSTVLGQVTVLRIFSVALGQVKEVYTWFLSAMKPFLSLSELCF